MESTANQPRGIHRRTRFDVTPPLRVRFWRRVDQRRAEDCWRWTGAERNGYGAIKHQGKVLGSHVVAYVLTYGHVPDGMLVLHICDNRLCCNPAHLYAGDFVDNVRDMYARHETAATRGQECWNAVLNEETVRAALALRKVYGWSRRRIAEALSVSEGAIKGVISRRTWRHVKEPTAQEAKAIADGLAMRSSG